MLGSADLMDDMVECVNQDIYSFSAELVGVKVCKSG